MHSREQFEGFEGVIATLAAARGFNEDGPEYRAREDLLRRKYRSWRGRSGRTYMFSVYSPFDCPAYEDAVLIVARRGADTRGGALAWRDLGRLAESELSEIRRRFADRLDAVEFHIHVLADRYGDRRRLIEDVMYVGTDA
jgi:hypothetical protein